MSTTIEIESVGYAACRIGVSVQRFDSVARELDIQPVEFRNGIAQYATADVDRVAEHIRESA